MPEPVSVAIVPGYAMAYRATRIRSAVSREAAAVRASASAIVASTERSFALFGAKSAVIERIYEVAAGCENDGWDGEDASGISSAVYERAIGFIRAFPDGLPLPEVAPEPDGSLSLDWIVARAIMFSVSVGETNRLAFAWIDGTDRGHGVARFDGDAIPARVLDGIREITNERTAPFRAA
jgi:hypothetical protein